MTCWNQYSRLSAKWITSTLLAVPKYNSMKAGQQDNTTDIKKERLYKLHCRFCSPSQAKIEHIKNSYLSFIMAEENWDVIIVGAGLSGLSAAHLLRKRNANLKILIVEGKGLEQYITITKKLVT